MAEIIEMKNKLKLFCLLIAVLSTLHGVAQIPPNNLGKTRNELQQKFHNLRFSESRNGFEEYTSDGITFTFKYGKVVAETMGVDKGRRFGYDWYTAMVNSFSKTSYSRVSNSEDSMMMTMIFYYPDFWITLGYWKQDGYTTITYQNSDYFK